MKNNVAVIGNERLAECHFPENYNVVIGDAVQSPRVVSLDASR